MKPLLFILTVLAISIYISLRLTDDATWFTYYKGGVAGLLVSGVILEFWTRRKKAKEEQERQG